MVLSVPGLTVSFSLFSSAHRACSVFNATPVYRICLKPCRARFTLSFCSAARICTETKVPYCTRRFRPHSRTMFTISSGPMAMEDDWTVQQPRIAAPWNAISDVCVIIE